MHSPKAILFFLGMLFFLARGASAQFKRHLLTQEESDGAKSVKAKNAVLKLDSMRKYFGEKNISKCESFVSKWAEREAFLRSYSVANGGDEEVRKIYYDARNPKRKGLLESLKPYDKAIDQMRVTLRTALGPIRDAATLKLLKSKKLAPKEYEALVQKKYLEDFYGLSALYDTVKEFTEAGGQVHAEALMLKNCVHLLSFTFGSVL